MGANPHDTAAAIGTDLAVLVEEIDTAPRPAIRAFAVTQPTPLTQPLG
jgi:hypothetical protein